MTQMESALKQAEEAALQATIAEMLPLLGAMTEPELKAMLEQLEQVMALDVCPYSGTHFVGAGNEPCVMVEADGTFRIGKRNYMEIRALRDGVPCVASGFAHHAINDLYTPLRDTRIAEEARAAAEAKRKDELIEQVDEIVSMLRTLNDVDRLEMTAEAFDATTAKIADKLKISDVAMILYRDACRAELEGQADLDAGRLTLDEALEENARIDETVAEPRELTAAEIAELGDPRAAIIDYAEAQIRHFDGGGEQTHEHRARVWRKALNDFRAGFRDRLSYLTFTDARLASLWSALLRQCPLTQASREII